MTESGSNPPLVKGRLATAGEIADPNTQIDNWQVVTGPMEPGDVIAIGHAGEGYTGHTGLYVGNGKVASASDITGRVELNNWGLRPGQTPTIRRCVCAQ